jgi:DNA-binding MarR family transcriptional regulator
MNNYQEAHLIVAAVRVLQHTKGTPPSVEEVGALLKFSTEMTHAVCRKLEKLGIVETVTDPFAVKVSITDHLGLEKIPRQQETADSLRQELENFQAKKTDMDKKVATIQAELKKKKESMFADLEARFKKEFEKSQK